MYSIWNFHLAKGNQNIKRIYYILFDSTPPNYEWKIEMKTGKIIELESSNMFHDLFTDDDMVAINNAKNACEEIYNRQKCEELKKKFLLLEREKRIQELLEKGTCSEKDKLLKNSKNKKCVIS